MEIVNITEIVNYDLNISSIVSMAQRWTNRSSYSYLTAPRPDNGLTLILCDRAEYNINEKPLIAYKGDIIYIPKGANYEVKFFFNDAFVSIATMLINFIITDNDGKEIKFSETVLKLMSNSPKNLEEKFLEIITVYNNSIKNTLVLKSFLYNLLSNISLQISRKNILLNEYKAISKGFLYIENNINAGFTISELAKMCSISETCFRNLFKKYTNASPIRYINNAKIEKAKQMLKSSEFSIEEICYALNFYDKAYFYKIFKAITGTTPLKFRKTSE